MYNCELMLVCLCLCLCSDVDGEQILISRILKVVKVPTFKESNSSFCEVPTIQDDFKEYMFESSHIDSSSNISIRSKLIGFPKYWVTKCSTYLRPYVEHVYTRRN